jgi:hypothetical protein
MRQVDIPFDYFQKLVIREYHNWKLAFIRELLQNSVDAGSTKIEINYDGTYITFSDNGSGMTKEIIQTALLKLGGSHKENDEAVGGMGNAKNVIYLAWPEWEVTSTECTVVGQGPKYEFNDKFCDRGVISKIKVEGKLGDIKNLIEGYLSKCDTNVAIFYNNELVPSDTFSKGEKVYEIEGLGNLYKVDKEYSYGDIFVQCHGLYMFNPFTILTQDYIFDITHPSYDCLTSNRDGFVGDWQKKFNEMVTKVAIDSESINLRKETIIKVTDIPEEETEGILTESEIDFLMKSPEVIEQIIDKGSEEVLKHRELSSQSVNKTKVFNSALHWYRKNFPEGFIIVTDQETDSDFVYELFHVTNLKIINLWRDIVNEIAELNGITKKFGFGFYMSPKCERLAECRDGYILINPYAYEDEYWDEIAIDMLLTASEELAHLMGYNYHNESFKNQYTKLIKSMLLDRTKVTDFLAPLSKVRKKI